MQVATLSEMLEEIVRNGEAVGDPAPAHELRGELEGRLATVQAAVSGARRPRVIALQALDPPTVCGLWVPEMISVAGGEDVAGPPGLAPTEVGWGALAGLRPNVAVLMLPVPAEDASAETARHWERIESLGATRVYAVDAGPAFSEPGPRLVDGVELLGHLLHPDLIDPPGYTGFAELRAPLTRPLET